MARNRVLLLLTAALAVAGVSGAVAQASTQGGSHTAHRHGRGGPKGSTATPIKHVVVIFQENESSAHACVPYPKPANPAGRRFHAARGTPAVDVLLPATSRSLPRSLR